MPFYHLWTVAPGSSSYLGSLFWCAPSSAIWWVQAFFWIHTALLTWLNPSVVEVLPVPWHTIFSFLCPLPPPKTHIHTHNTTSGSLLSSLMKKLTGQENQVWAPKAFYASHTLEYDPRHTLMYHKVNIQWVKHKSLSSSYICFPQLWHGPVCNHQRLITRGQWYQHSVYPNSDFVKPLVLLFHRPHWGRM